METTPPRTDKPGRNRRWFQFSLRTLLIFVTLFCFVAGWFGLCLHRAAQQRQTVAELNAAGCQVRFDWFVKADGTNDDDAKPPGAEWLRNLLGSDFFDTAVAVESAFKENRSRHFGDAEIELTSKFPHLQQLTIYESSATAVGVARLAELQQLESLEVFDRRVDDSWIEATSKLTSTSSLKLMPLV